MIIKAAPTDRFPAATIRQALTDFIRTLSIGEPVQIDSVINRLGNPSNWNSVIATIRSISSAEGIKVSIERSEGSIVVRRTV